MRATTQSRSGRASAAPPPIAPWCPAGTSQLDVARKIARPYELQLTRCERFRQRRAPQKINQTRLLARQFTILLHGHHHDHLATMPRHHLRPQARRTDEPAELVLRILEFPFRHSARLLDRKSAV